MKSNRRPQEQGCKVCGVRDDLDFHVPDRVWEVVVPNDFRRLVVCLRCFDRFAWEKGIQHQRSPRFLYFVGDPACFKFRVVRCNTRLSFRAIPVLFLVHALITEFARRWL
jgi:hypothetical protein